MSGLKTITGDFIAELKAIKDDFPPDDPNKQVEERKDRELEFLATLVKFMGIISVIHFHDNEKAPGQPIKDFLDAYGEAKQRSAWLSEDPMVHPFKPIEELFESLTHSDASTALNGNCPEALRPLVECIRKNDVAINTRNLFLQLHESWVEYVPLDNST